MSSQTELYRAMLDGADIAYEAMDNSNYRHTYFKVTLGGETFEADFEEPLNGTPGTLGAMRELSFTSWDDIGAEDAFRVVTEVMAG